MSVIRIRPVGLWTTLFLLVVVLQELQEQGVESFTVSWTSASRRSHHLLLSVEPDDTASSSFLKDARKSSDLTQQLARAAQQAGSILSLVVQSLTLSTVSPTDIVACCDALDDLKQQQSQAKEGEEEWVDTVARILRQQALEFQRYSLLTKLLQDDSQAYVATASFLSPSRIPRADLPNVQDVPYLTTNSEEQEATETTTQTALVDDNGVALVADCELDTVTYQDSWLDQLLLNIFRNLVTKHTGGVTSDKPGIEGLLEQGRTFMLQPGQTPEAQHEMVSNTLGSLMTPVLPPFYRIFMSGIVPKKFNTPWDGKQVGPWFYAPWLTSIVTPTFFGFLVGPSRPNRRRDGHRGGLVVEKCKFLQESGCKGLCLHQCKLPAQQFFATELGLPLTVTPNFVTQECQWSFGETPIVPSQDPSFPSGCLQGCPSRSILAETRMAMGADDQTSNIKVDLCNYSG